MEVKDTLSEEKLDPFCPYTIPGLKEEFLSIENSMF